MGAYESPEAAYWAFFETFNAKSASGRAGVMSYPHVRVSAARSEPSIHETAEAFEASATWAPVEQTGWAWTQPITPRVVHSSPDKVHFAGGWTRCRADGSMIARNRLLYIATEMDDGWGIQGAFGVEGALTGLEAEAPSAAAMATHDREAAALRSGDLDAWLDCYHYPMIIVFAPGQIALYHTRAEVAAAYRDWVAGGSAIRQTARLTAVGPSGALIEQSITFGDVYFEQSALIVEREGVWGISAVSAVRPYG